MTQWAALLVMITIGILIIVMARELGKLTQRILGWNYFQVGNNDEQLSLPL